MPEKTYLVVFADGRKAVYVESQITSHKDPDLKDKIISGEAELFYHDDATGWAVYDPCFEEGDSVWASWPGSFCKPWNR